MRIEIKVIFTIETRDESQATEIVEKLSKSRAKTHGFKSFLFTLDESLIERSELQIAGPSFDIHHIHEPEIDGPKDYAPGQPDAIDPTVLITDADGSPVR